jgi:hypothetical protein
MSARRGGTVHNGAVSPHRIVAIALTVALAVGCSSTSEDDAAGAGPGGDDDASATTADPSATTAVESSTSSESSTTTTTPPPPAELPGGGREIFPRYRVVANYGNAESSAMGILGQSTPEQAAERLAVAAAPFEQPDRPVLPAFELIVSVAQGSPGSDGNYSVPTADELVLRWLAAAREADMLLILDIQPGTSHFLPEVQRFEEFLRQPDVGLALDPEWRMGPGEVPGTVIGGVDAAEVNEVSAWLADIVEEDDLPEKLFVLHQFTESMITNRPDVIDRPGLASVYHVDGFGGRDVKLEKYALLKGTPPFATGLKLFYDEDINMFAPADVLALESPPDLITYQ